MKKIICTLCLCLFLTQPAFADSKQDKINEIFKLTGVSEMLETAYDQAFVQLQCQLVLTPQQEEDLKKELQQLLDIQPLIDQSSQFWIQNFTEQELDEVIAFYKTPLGQKTIKLMPKYMESFMKSFQSWFNQSNSKLTKFAQKLSEEYAIRPQAQTRACMQKYEKKNN